MKYILGKKAFTYTSILGGLLVAAACGSDEAPTDVGSTGGAPTATGGKASMGTGGRAAGGKTGTGGATNTGGSAGGDASANGGASGAGGTNPTTDASPDVSAGGATGTGGAAGTGGTDSGPTDCFTNPTTHFEIINACTTAEKVDKNPVLPLNLADGGLKPLP